MKQLQNPYKRPGFEVPTRQIAASVSEEEYLRVIQSLPFRGTQDGLFSTLFYNFYQDFKQLQLPPYYEPDTTRKIEALLRRDDV